MDKVNEIGVPVTAKDVKDAFVVRREPLKSGTWGRGCNRFVMVYDTTKGNEVKAGIGWLDAGRWLLDSGRGGKSGWMTAINPEREDLQSNPEQ